MRRLITRCRLRLGALTLCAGAGIIAATPAGAVCQFATTTLAFGVVDVARGVDSTGGISVTCAAPTSFEVAIIGNGSPGNRHLAGPDGARLGYDVYPDATHSVPWSDGNGSGATFGASNDGSGTTTIPIYGRIPIQQAVPAGQYLDALTVSITF